MEKTNQIFILTRKVFIAWRGHEILSDRDTAIAGVFDSERTALLFANTIVEGIENGESRVPRTFVLTSNSKTTKHGMRFSLAQEQSIYPRFVFECTQEQVLGYK